MVVAAVGYLLTQPIVSRLAGDFWGPPLTMILILTPLVVWHLHSGGMRLPHAWKTGVLFAFASAVVYAWAFSGGWV